MNRLLQGDVGSGKTIVALMAAVVAMENGFQVAFMAPTEILAEQHFITIRKLLETSRFRVDAADRLDPGAPAARGAGRARRRRAPPGGRHPRAGAGPVAFRELGLVVIDEQHRFGVLQRATLRAKGLHPDVLVMTATPIPRTLALTIYGDLDVSVMREMPPGRQPITTIAQAGIAPRRNLRVRARAGRTPGRQAYVIYPLVEESEKVDLKAATEMAEHLRRKCSSRTASRCCTGG